MAGLTNTLESGVKLYDVLTENVEKKLLSNLKRLEVDKIIFDKKAKYSIVFYDTPDNLLCRSGILVYKTNESDGYFFKVEKLNFLPNISKLHKAEVFSHPIEAKDLPKNHSFYLVNGISSLFTTQFSVDLEHMIKNLKPIILIEIKANIYKVLNGKGLKCNLEFQEVLYKNLITRRKRENKELSAVLTGPQTSSPIYNNFLTLLEKYCKDILPKNETRFDYAQKITKIMPKKSKNENIEKKKKEKKQRNKSVENQIEG